MQMRVIVLAISCAASSLTLTALSSVCAPPQAQEERVADTKQSISGADADVKKMSMTSKIARHPETEPFESSRPGLQGLAKRFLEDQEQIWTSPSKIRFSDTQWLVPLSGITAGLFVTDTDYSKHLSQNPSTISHYKTLSNAGVGALIGGAGGMWLLGHVRHNEHWSETGFLAGEAAINSLVAVETLKYSLGRQRPFQGNGTGPFFQGGTSFPSEHSAAAWSIAGVVAHEYPGPLMKIMAYGLATLVDYSRLRARQHFPSDVLVGSIMGNLIAQNVYSRHHDPGLGGGEWRSISQIFRGDGNLSPGNMGSPYVPIDSWVYPAFDRLAALGYVNSGMFGMRPWTRLECVRLLNEAVEQLDQRGSEDTQALHLYDSLVQEFSNDFANLARGENRNLRVESVYTRVTGISGVPLTDGYHFGQTIANNFGRPFAEGFSTVDGFSGWASGGRFATYIRGEYQHAPSIPALPLQARQFIASADGAGMPVPPDSVTPAVDQFQLLEAYVAMNVENWQFSFGRQTLLWGPSLSGPLMFSGNAAPVDMFRVSRTSPFKLPSILGWMGPIRMEFFLGQLAGQEFIFAQNTGLVGQFGHPLDRQPFIDGYRIGFKPTQNFEFGLSVTAVFSGATIPLTSHTFLRSLSLGNTIPGAAGDPGDRRSGINFTYKIPKLRDWLTFYGEAFTEDEFSPLGYPRKSAYQGGIYMPRIPGIPKLDFRVEGGSTVPPDFPDCIGCFYINGRYLNGYTNRGNLMGSWLGRAGQGEQIWSTYWLTPRNNIQFNYRHQKVDGRFIPGGATLNDGGVRGEFWLGTTVKVTGAVQYEKWNYPVLDPLPRSNVTTTIGLSFWPRNWGLQAKSL